MYIVNQTLLVEDSILAEWLDWVRLIYIPEVMASGFFSSHKMLKLIEGGTGEGSTFALQFVLHSEKYKKDAIHNFEVKYEWLITDTFGTKTLFFRTLLEDVS